MWRINIITYAKYKKKIFDVFVALSGNFFLSKNIFKATHIVGCSSKEPFLLCRVEKWQDGRDRETITWLWFGIRYIIGFFYHKSLEGIHIILSKLRNIPKYLCLFLKSFPLWLNKLSALLLNGDGERACESIDFVFFLWSPGLQGGVRKRTSAIVKGLDTAISEMCCLLAPHCWVKWAAQLL